MSSRLAMKRLSLSDSSMIVASRSAFSASLSLLPMSRSAPAAPSTAASGVLRSCEMEVSSADRSRSVSATRSTRSISSTSRTRSIASAPWSSNASSSRRWSVRQHRARLVAVDAHDADGAASGMHRQEQALGAGQRVGAAAGGAVVFPGPSGGGEIGLVENIFRRIAGLDRDRAVLGQQQHDAHFQHQRGLIGGRPKHVVERAGAGELAAERIKRFGDAGAFGCRLRLRASARGDARRR